MTDETRPEEPGSENAATVTEPAGEGAASVTEPAAETASEDGEKKEPEKLHQAVELIDIGPCKKHIKVTIERADIDSRLDKKYSELVVDANVAGFRPGKAPRKIIEKRFRKDVHEQVKAEVLLQSLEQLADEHDVAPLTAPDINPNKIDIPDKGPLIYEFDVEVRPEFDLPSYKGLKLKRPVRTFTDEDVARSERRLLEPYGQLVPKPADGAGEPTVDVGDIIISDLTTRDGDRLIGTAKEMRTRVETQLAFKDGVAQHFADQVKGAKAGESRIVEIVLSDNVAEPALRAKTVQGVFEIKDIKVVRLPELSHDLLHHFGAHSPDQLRELVRVALQRNLAYEQRQAAREQVLAEIAAASQWELPQDLLIRQARKALARRVMEMRSAGISEEEITARQRLLQQDVLRTTALSLKEHFVLQKIAEVEKIDIDEDDIDDEIQRLADQTNESPRRVRARLEKDDLLDALAAEIIERKTLDLILGTAEYEDVPVGPQPAGTVSTVEEQAVPGEMQDPTAVPPPSPEESGSSAGDK